MKRSSGRTALTLIMANCVFGLASCGGSGDSSIAAAPAPVPPSAVPPPPSVSPPFTYTASLSWSVPLLNTDGTPLTDISGYRVYYGTSPTNLAQSIAVSGAGNTTYVVSDLTPGTYYFAVVTLNATCVATCFGRRFQDCSVDQNSFNDQNGRGGSSQRPYKGPWLRILG